MKEEDIHLHLLSRYVSGAISLEEVEELLQWISEDPEREELLRDFQKTWDLAKTYPVTFNVDTNVTWTTNKNTLSETEPSIKINTRLAKKWIAVISIFAIIIIGVVLAFQYLYMKK